MAYIEKNHTVSYSMLDKNDTIGRMELTMPNSSGGWFSGGNSLDETSDYCGVKWAGLNEGAMLNAIQRLINSPIQTVIISQHYIEDSPPDTIDGENQKRGVFEVRDVMENQIHIEIPGMKDDFFNDTVIKFPEDSVFPDHELVKFRKEILADYVLGITDRATVISHYGHKLDTFGDGWKIHRQSPKIPGKRRG